MNFPEHEVPYRYKRVEVDGMQARYIRLIATENHQYWLALNEILVNEGMDRPGAEIPALEVDPPGDLGNEASDVIDSKLSTFYTPIGDPQPGYLNYKLSQDTELSEAIVLQGPDAISEATVSVRDTSGWHQIGTLSESYNAFDLSAYEHVLEIQLAWDGSIKPQIYEIVPVKKKGVELPPINNVADLITLVEQLEEEGAFDGEDIARSLTRHLTAIERYEDKQAADKVVKHMENFKLLLDHQQENALISEEAYIALNRGADSLIEKWQ